MTDLEQLVRDTLHARAADLPVPSITGLLRADSSRPLVRCASVAAAAVLVTSVAVTVAALAGSTSRSSAPPAHPRPTVSAGPIPAGDHRISYHGITMAVPSSFAVGVFPCSLPTTNRVTIVDGEFYSCPAELGRYPQKQTVTDIRLLPDGLDTPLTRLATQAFVVDNTAALRGSGVNAGIFGSTPMPVSVIDVPAPGVTIAVSGPQQGPTINALLATLHVTPVDALGCPAQLRTLVPSGNPPSSELVPGHPVAGVVCQYGITYQQNPAHWLAGSASLTPDQLSALTAFADHLPSVSATASPPQLFTLRYQLRYADGTRRTLAVANISTPTATDGQHTAVVAGTGPDCYGTGCPRNAFPGAYTN